MEKSVKLVGYRVNTQNQLHFYVLTVNSLKRYYKPISFTIVSKVIKYLGISQEVKNFNNEYYETFLKKKKTEKQKPIPCSWIERLNIVKMSILSM